MNIIDNTYKKLVDNIGTTLQRARENAIKAVNRELVIANWEIGKHIVEFEQNGKEKAEYGSSLCTQRTFTQRGTFVLGKQVFLY